MHNAGQRRGGQDDPDHRGPGREGAARRAKGLDRGRRAAMRLLSIGADHGRGRAHRAQSQPERRRHRCGDVQYLPLRDLSAHARRGAPRRRARQDLRETAMTMILSRRFFIQASLSAAGGLMIAAFAPEFAGATSLAGEPWSPETGKTPDEVNAFVVIDPDSSIRLRVPKSEMGQGVLTSLAMILAEELECDFAKVKVEYASGHRNLTQKAPYQQMGTGGSSSVRRSRVFLQQAGASARERLIRAAASRWAVEPAACAAGIGEVRHEASSRSATYGELAADAAGITLPREPAIKTPEEFKLIGAAQKRLDTPLKVTGAARFGIDARLPGMVYAAVANCPVFGGKLKSYDFSAVAKRRGVIAAMPVTNGVAVVADNFWRAKEALAAMAVEWDLGPAASTDSAQFRAEYRAALDGPLANGGGHGDSEAAFAAPAKLIEAVYEVPYLAHAPMEPLN